MRQFDFYV